MKRDLVRLPKLDSSFMSCEKDTETILRKLFIESQPYSSQLKRLMVINTKDCLDSDDKRYTEIVDSMTLKKLREDRYIGLEPKIMLGEHENIKSYINISFDNFTPNAINPEFRDCNVNFDVLCHTDYWDIGNYRLRPFKIIGIVDGLLNEARLSGIGTLHFARCNEMVLDSNISGYSLSYRAVHMTDDALPAKDE